MKSHKIVKDDSPLNTYNVLDRETGEVLGHVTGWSRSRWTAKDAHGHVLYQRPLTPSSTSRYPNFSLRKHAVNRVVQEARG